VDEQERESETESERERERGGERKREGERDRERESERERKQQERWPFVGKRKKHRTENTNVAASGCTAKLPKQAGLLIPFGGPVDSHAQFK